MDFQNEILIISLLFGDDSSTENMERNSGLDFKLNFSRKIEIE